MGRIPPTAGKRPGEARRAALQADPDWQAYLGKSAEAGYLVRQTNKILMPVPLEG